MMEKLGYLDASFLRLESPRHPFHVAGLLIFKLPDNAPKNFLRKLVAEAREFNTIWPILNKKLNDPEDLGKSAWIQEEDYRPERHVLHYALPAPGRMEDLLDLISRAHERQLDRSRPLWEVHLIEGLPRGRFALYCKLHHALVDGLGAMKMMDGLFTTSPRKKRDLAAVGPVAERHEERRSLLQGMGSAGRTLFEHYRAVPQLSSLLAHMGLDALLGAEDTMRLPFTSPHSVFNTDLDTTRRAVLCDMPFSKVRGMAKKTGGSMNDVLLAICGGALRRYLKEIGQLPRKSLIAGLPVAIRPDEAHSGNQLSFIMCPFFTDEADDGVRLQRVIRSTRKAKAELSSLTTTARQDFSNLLLMPTVLLTLTGQAARVNPIVNAIFSNVPGPRQKMYLEGAELESFYPLSVITDGLGLNITVVSYTRKLCFAVTSCPTAQPGIDELDRHLKESYRALGSAIDNS
ncbi:MAG: wax ester/triacylglycerol synthase family O-acyltransferase [Halioglobus sp.]|nr:wax ester/triacylglycerol synthase family O-acyltransferase [Halioglobus sp.]